MIDPASPVFWTILLAAISAAAFILTIFFPLIIRSPLRNRRSAMFDALLKGKAASITPATRTVRRAQEAALRSVMQHGAAKRQSPLQTRLSAAGLDWTPRFFLGLCATFCLLIFRLGLFAGFSLTMSITIALITAWVVPQRYLVIRANKRKKAFLDAFSDAVDMVVRGIKSGLSVLDCMSMVASDAPSPVREEFETIVAQLQAGLPLPAALEKLNTAMPAAEVRFFTMIMTAQSQTGGNLSEALSNLSGVLRDRETIASKIRVSSAEGRTSALIIGSLPFTVIGVTAAFAPDYIAFLWTDDSGRRIAAFCFLWLMFGMLVLGRMARIEV